MLETSTVRRFSLQVGDFKIEVDRFGGGALASAPASAPAPAVASAAAVAPGDTRRRINAPLVGTFYRAQSPGAKPFVEVGTRVQRGQTIGIIEAMKVMNEVSSDTAGVVAEILVQNGETVQFDQPLLVIDPAG